jgi:succinate dehydrogenase / fumarate reductase cytochrome b subunit
VVSIGHRLSGMLLVCALPFAVLGLERSLASKDTFGSVVGALQSWGGRIVLLVLAWAAAHHLFAGIRHLLMDVGIGAGLPPARASAYSVLVGGAAVALATLAL